MLPLTSLKHPDWLKQRSNDLGFYDYIYSYIYPKMAWAYSLQSAWAALLWTAHASFCNAQI